MTNCKIFRSTRHRRADVVGNKARITSLSVTVCKPLRLRPKSDPDDILLVLSGGAPLVLRGLYAHENPYFDSGSLAAEYRIRLCWSGRPVPEKAEGGPPSGRPGAVLDESNAERFGQKAAGSSDTLTYDKAGPYVTNMQAADPDNDGKFTKSEFMEACKKGLVQAGQQARRNRRRSNA